jgi:hypothetical protein
VGEDVVQVCLRSLDIVHMEVEERRLEGELIRAERGGVRRDVRYLHVERAEGCELVGERTHRGSLEAVWPSAV